jgi:hypothetical protein
MHGYICMTIRLLGKQDVIDCESCDGQRPFKTKVIHQIGSCIGTFTQPNLPIAYLLVLVIL